MTITKYSSNNSGGDWWLTDADWLNLENAGWQVAWEKDKTGRWAKGDRFLGALATSATREGLTHTEAIDEWETITGQDAYADGCSCCGRPHEFYTPRDRS